MGIPIAQITPLSDQAINMVANQRATQADFLRNLATHHTSRFAYITVLEKIWNRFLFAPSPLGSTPHLNTTDPATITTRVPPFYYESIMLSLMDGYNLVYGDHIDNASVRNVDILIDEIMAAAAQILAAFEDIQTKQIAEALTEHKVSLVSGGDITFPTKAGNIIDAATVGGAYWDVLASSDPLKDLAAACNACVKNGKASASQFMVIMGEQTYADFENSTKIKETANLLRISNISIPGNQLSPAGGVRKGIVDAGSFSLEIFTFPSHYDLPLGGTEPFIPPKSCSIMSAGSKIDLWFGGLPSLAKDSMGNVTGYPIVAAEWVSHDIMDPARMSHAKAFRTAPLAILTLIDQFANVKTHSDAVVPVAAV